MKTNLGLSLIAAVPLFAVEELALPRKTEICNH